MTMGSLTESVAIQLHYSVQCSTMLIVSFSRTALTSRLSMKGRKLYSVIAQ